MNFKKNLTPIAVSALLFTLVGCGNDSNSSRNKSSVVNPVCDSINCLSSIDWKINLPGQVFPEKTRLEINGDSVLDECVAKQQYSIDRESAPQSITLINYLVPKKGSLKIKVVDQGWDCSKEMTFLSHDNVSFRVTKGFSGRRIEIDL